MTSKKTRPAIRRSLATTMKSSMAGKPLATYIAPRARCYVRPGLMRGIDRTGRDRRRTRDWLASPCINNGLASAPCSTKVHPGRCH